MDTSITLYSYSLREKAGTFHYFELVKNRSLWSLYLKMNRRYLYKIYKFLTQTLLCPSHQRINLLNMLSYKSSHPGFWKSVCYFIHSRISLLGRVWNFTQQEVVASSRFRNNHVKKKEVHQIFHFSFITLSDEICVKAESCYTNELHAVSFKAT